VNNILLFLADISFSFKNCAVYVPALHSIASDRFGPLALGPGT
jgi:hypothetical protein